MLLSLCVLLLYLVESGRIRVESGTYVADYILQLIMCCSYDAKQLKQNEGMRAIMRCTVFCLSVLCQEVYHGKLLRDHFSD